MNATKEPTMPFQKGDIITKAGTVYSRGALIVDGYDDQGRLMAHPKGGGPQFVLKPGAEKTFRLVTPEEQQQPLWRTSRFSLEGVETSFKGWTSGDLWNGWEKPHFELAEAQTVVATLDAPKIRFDPTADAFVNSNGDEEDEVWAVQIITTLGPVQVKVYPVGAGSWCWEEAEGSVEMGKGKGRTP